MWPYFIWQYDLCLELLHSVRMYSISSGLVWARDYICRSAGMGMCLLVLYKVNKTPMNNVIVKAHTSVGSYEYRIPHTRPTHSLVVLDRDHGQSAERGVGLPAPIASATS